MTFEQLFTLANNYILPFWALMIFLPNWEITKKIMGSYWLFVPLIGLYAYYNFGTIDLELLKTLASPSLSGIAAYLSQQSSAGAAWLHFLSLDLFLGRWIYWQGQAKNIWTFHSLILSLFFGPIGLLSHLFTARLFAKEKVAES